jgi:general secretion pathway protein C
MTRTITIANILLGIIVIAFLASIVANGLSRSLNIPLLPKQIKSTANPAAGAIKTADLAYYAPILTSSLFGKATQGQLSPIVNAPTGSQAAPVTAPAELLLLGTATGSFRETFALVRHSAKQEERVFRLGDMVFDAGRLVQVTHEQAFIVVNGKKVELLTPMTPPTASPQTQQQPAGQPGTGVTSTGAGSYVIDQRALSAALDNIGQAMTDARLLPSQKDGKVEGFRASEVKPSGVFAMIGIKNGDVLLRLNDYPMDSPDKALQSFIALKGQNRLKLDIIRDGRPATYTYDIR